MFKEEIAITSLAEAKNFVNMAGKYMGLRIFLYNNNYKMDAHSIMGVISLDMSQPIYLEVEGNNIPPEFIEDLKPFVSAKEVK